MVSSWLTSDIIDLGLMSFCEVSTTECDPTAHLKECTTVIVDVQIIDVKLISAMLNTRAGWLENLQEMISANQNQFERIVIW